MAADLVVTQGLLQVGGLAELPAIPCAMAMCWVHGFVLPGVFGRPSRGRWRMVAGVAAGMVLTLLAAALGGLAGFYTGSLSLAVILAGEQAGGAPGAAVDMLADSFLWLATAVATSVAAVTACGLAALVPGVWRVRLSWRVACVGVFGPVLFVPQWWWPGLHAPWREAVLVVAVALPCLALNGCRAIVRG